MRRSTRQVLGNFGSKRVGQCYKSGVTTHFSYKNYSSRAPPTRPEIKVLYNQETDFDHSSPSTKSPYVTQLAFISQREILPAYRVMNTNGDILIPESDPGLPKEECVRMYTTMVRLSIMDEILNEAQRQGRISFYMTSSGEEATHIGSAAALQPDDVVYAQYREAGVLMYRGFTFEDFMNQCFGNELDPGKGRQMPVHYGSAKLNFHTISSPLATQIPQAAGAGYFLKLENKGRCCICYFGEGAASEGDFHAALNMAATLSTPTIFFCRNNGYAISTPSHEQYAGDGIAARGPAYGIHTLRLDGNDIWAVYNGVKAARKIAVEQGKPVLIEAMTYRIGHHSTSDDSKTYRRGEDIDEWKKKNSPIERLRRYLGRKEWWSEGEEKELRERTRKEVVETLKSAGKVALPHRDGMWSDVYDEMSDLLKEEQRELEEHIAKYPDHYNTTGGH
eukprot:TRINITY_DN8144_c0_g1_i1.p1 TRINITY_DN8144_c0_g1~~TRINITY_DN8144_c0_g1_i1.p1  ORF type:complete len:455 (-),score=134.67 TRINITY_DN8144_c0_g1_i1:86-1429(-)